MRSMIRPDQKRAAVAKADDYITRDGRTVGDLTLTSETPAAPYVVALATARDGVASGDELDRRARRSDLLSDLTAECNEAQDGRGALSRAEIADVLHELSLWFTPRD